MAVLGRLLFGSGERLDLPDLLSIDSYTAADFKYFIQTFIGGDRPYILKGFDVLNPADAIGTENVSIRVADSVVYYPGSNAGSFYYGLPEGNASSVPVVPELRKNATNFVYLTFNTFDTAKDSRAFWDPDANGGDGAEFSQDINTESVLSIEVNVSVSTFPDNTIPICRVVVGPSVIESIQDCRDMMFRLGTGGAIPNPFSDFAFREDPSSAYARSEPPTTMTSSLDPNPFQGGDKNLYTLKEWMDVVMTKLKEIGGTTYWYEGSSGGPSPTPAISNIFMDALASTLKSKGEWQHSGTTPGECTWTQDIHYVSLRDNRDIIFRDSTINLNNGEVAWVNLVREADLNGSLQQVSWVVASNIVNGITGAFSNLSKGDWIKKKTDSALAFARVEEFYALPNLAGGVTTAVLAQSVRLNVNYAGTTGTELGEYTKGEYLSTDIEITSRDDATVQAAGGNFFWLAHRNDTILSLQSATSYQLTIDITDADGERAKVSATGHGLIDGDRVTITTGSYAGTHIVEEIDANNFYIQTIVTGNELGQTAFYAIIETAARNTTYSYNLETAEHGFQSDQTVVIQNTSTVFDGSYIINVRSTTEFQVPFGSLIADPGPLSGEIVVLPRLNLRTEFGVVKVVQGESINIGDSDSKNVLSYIGMNSLAQTTPHYHIDSGSNMIHGYANYNSDEDENLTVRTSRLTAMMADRIQDRAIQLIGRINISNVTNGANQDISASDGLFLVMPRTDDQFITLTTPIPLPADSAIVIDFDRNTPLLINPTVVDLDTDFLLSENRLVLFYRFATTDVYDWLGNKIAASGHINTGAPEDSQNRNIHIFNPGEVVLDTGTGLITIGTNPTPDDITIVIPGSGDNNIIDVSAINTLGTLIVANGDSVWVRINRNNLKTFNTVLTTDTPDTDGAGALYITSTASVPYDQDVFVLWSRVSNRLISIHHANKPVTDVPLKMHEDGGSNRTLLIEDYTVNDVNTGRNTSIPPISNILPTGITFPIEIGFPATSGGTITISGTIFSGGGTPTLTVSSGTYIKVGVNLDATGAITLTFGAEGATPALATAPATVDGTFAIGYVLLHNLAGVIQNVVASSIYQYIGGGGGGGSGTGNPILETIKNQFVDSPYELVTPNIIATDGDTLFSAFSGAAYDIANKVIRFTADAQTATSINMLDTDEFLLRGIDVTSIDLDMFWNPGSSLQAFDVPTSFTYEVSRDGGINYFPVTMTRVGTTDTFNGSLRFDTSTTTESTQQNLQSISGGVQTDLDLNATTSQQISQSFTVPAGQVYVIKKVLLTLTKTGTPSGNVYLSIVRNNLGVPSTTLGDVLAQTNAIVASGLVTGSNTIDVPTTILTGGTYHFVLSSDATYKSGFSGLNKLQVKETDVTTGESSYNGTTWSAVIGKALVSTVQGRNLDLRVKITSAGAPLYPVGLDGYGIFYNLQDVGIVGQNKKTQQFVFASGSTNTFAITAFNPDPDLLTCYVDNTGQAFKVPTFTLYGNSAVFPANFFDNGGISTTFTIRFDQNTGGSYDNADTNARLLAANHLGSTAGSDDRSVAGRGIILRNGAGVLMEIALDVDGLPIILSVP